MTALVLVGFLAVAALEVPGLVRRRYWRELAAFGVLWTAGLALSLWLASDRSLPWVALEIGRALSAVLRRLR